MTDVLYATYLMVYRFYLLLVDYLLYGNTMLNLLVLFFYVLCGFFLMEALIDASNSK